MAQKGSEVSCRYHGAVMVLMRADEPLGYWRTEHGVSRVSRKRQATLRANNVRMILRCPVMWTEDGQLRRCPCVASLPGEQEEDEETPRA